MYGLKLLFVGLEAGVGLLVLLVESPDSGVRFPLRHVGTVEGEFSEGHGDFVSPPCTPVGRPSRTEGCTRFRGAVRYGYLTVTVGESLQVREFGLVTSSVKLPFIQ